MKGKYSVATVVDSAVVKEVVSVEAAVDSVAKEEEETSAATVVASEVETHPDISMVDTILREVVREEEATAALPEVATMNDDQPCG